MRIAAVKRIVALTICLLMVFLCFAPSVSAIQPENTQTEVLENGDSLVSGIGDPLLTTAPEDTPAATFSNLIRFLKRLIYFFTGTKTVEKTKYLRYYDQNGVLLWEATLTAEFAYSSKQVRCEDAGCLLFHWIGIGRSYPDRRKKQAILRWVRFW